MKKEVKENLYLGDRTGDSLQKSTFTNPFVIAARNKKNLVLRTSDIDPDTSGITNEWTLDTAGNLTLPAGGTITEGGGLTGAIRLTPAGGANAYQALVIYPTAAGPDGDHIHLTAGGGTTELYLGSDTHYVKLVDGGDVEVQATTATWTFDTDGNIDAQQALGIKVPNGVPSSVTVINNTTVYWETNPLSNLATIGGSGTGLTVNVTETGGYASAIAIATAGTGYTSGDVITVVSGTSTTNFTIAVAGNRSWTFDTAGNLTLPVGGDILDENGDSVLNGDTPVAGDPRLTIHGYLDGVTVPGTAKNFVTFTTGNDPISALYLTKYISVDNRAWFAIQVGSTWTASQTAITADHVAYGHFGPNATIVNTLGSNLLATTNYTLLPETSYTMWIQQINAIAEYAFSTSPLDQGDNEYTVYSNVTSTPNVIPFYTSIGSGPVALSEEARLSNTILEGTTTHNQLVEAIRTKTGAGLTVVHDFKTSSTWYHSSISQDFTPNFINVPTNNERVIVCKLILAQSATPYIPNAVQIAGSSKTINWLGSSQPSGTANKKDVVTFTLIRTGSAWVVLGKLETYGTI